MNRIYRYTKHESTGDNDYIIKDSININYFFSKDSNIEAVESFNSLNSAIKFSDTENKIYFIGRFTGKIKQADELFPERYDISEKIRKYGNSIPIQGESGSTKFHEFKLNNWYIEVPFRERNIKNLDLIFINRKELLKGDFHDYKDTFKLGRHVKKREEI